MERRDFIQKSVLTGAAMAAGSLASGAPAPGREWYEWRVYEMRFGQGAFDNFLSHALIPALNRFGIKTIGVFGEMGKSEPAKVHVLIPYQSFEEFTSTGLRLKEDKEFRDASASYDQLQPEQAAYSRYESWLMQAFEGFPQMNVPEKDSRIFELRSYEGYNEDAVRRKIKMFNAEELPIFNRAKLIPVFFGEVLIGPGLPRLTYMLTFRNMEEREKAWKAFGPDEDWQRVSKLPEYANTVSRIYKTFLEPLAYSQI